MTRVYLAAPYGAREQIREHAVATSRLGVVVTSSWLRETHEINGGTQGAATALPAAMVAGHALDDLRDVLSSDLLVLFTSAAVGVEGGGGRHVETGVALAMGIPVVVVGEPENIFHRIGLPQVQVVPEFDFALESIARRARGACIICDCTDDRACSPPCWWAGRNFCSACAA